MIQKKLYKTVNVFVLLISMILGVVLYKKIDIFLYERVGAIVGVLLLTAIGVHFIKAMRLYFEFFDKRMPLNIFLRQYCKVVPVSMILPFKLGDFFRAYCFGYQLDSYLSGSAVIVLDRFVDSTALVSIILVAYVVMNMKVTTLFYLLLIFISGLVVLYLIFPQMTGYWNRYFLKAKTTQRSIKLLKIIQQVNMVYSEIKFVVKGKFVITYLLSLFAWGIEIGGLIFSVRLLCEKESLIISEYLSSALWKADSVYLSEFVVISSVLLSCIYILLCIISLFRKADENE